MKMLKKLPLENLRMLELILLLLNNLYHKKIMRLINKKRAVSVVGFRGFDLDDSNSDARLFTRLTSIGNS